MTQNLHVPLLLSLERLLQQDVILHEVQNCTYRTKKDGLIEDYCDGFLFKSNPLFSSEPHSLQIIAYYDELELCNPLGTHVKQHKLGIIFYVLGNIHPKYCSSLKAINLVACAPVPFIEKHGINKILEPFINDLIVLYSTGVTVVVQNNSHNFKGALLAFLADNLASNLLGGLKLSFSFAFRCCRTCMTPTKKFSEYLTDNDCVLRDTKSHEEHCDLLKTPAFAHYSKVYGINNCSSLLDVPTYSMFGGGLPHDLMHDVFEGVVSVEGKLLLTTLINQGFFSYEYYNEALASFPYGYCDSDKPIPVTKRTFHNSDKLHLSASQAILFVRMLPLIIGKKIPENNTHWNCFLLLSDILLSPVVSEGLCSTLKDLIRDHHSL